MIKRSTSRARLGAASAAVLAILVLSTGSVFADTTPPGDGRFSQNGKSAEAGSSGCVSNGDDTTTCSDLGVSVFVGRMSDSLTGVTHVNQACVYHSTYVYDEVTGELVGEPILEYGCEVDLPTASLTFGAKLSTVTIRPTVVSLEQVVCDDEKNCEPGASRDVTVSGTWTGFGPTMSSKYRSAGDDGTCRYAESSKGSSREATFVGTVGTDSFGSDAYAYISDGRSTFRSRCTET